MASYFAYPVSEEELRRRRENLKATIRILQAELAEIKRALDQAT